MMIRLDDRLWMAPRILDDLYARHRRYFLDYDSQHCRPEAGVMDTAYIALRSPNGHFEFRVPMTLWIEGNVRFCEVSMRTQR